jgi:hypothetical protein
MKLYRIQARYKNIYIDKTLEAEDDKAALAKFANGLDTGDNRGVDEGFYDPDKPFITFEEVDRDATTKVNIGETSIGVQVGDTGISSRQSYS